MTRPNGRESVAQRGDGHNVDPHAAAPAAAKKTTRKKSTETDPGPAAE